MVGSASAIGEISRRAGSRCQSPGALPLPRPHWHDPAPEEPMGKWPTLDKIEMIDGPIDDEDLRARAPRSCSTACSTCRSITCAPAAGHHRHRRLGRRRQGRPDRAHRRRPRAEIDPGLAHRRADAPRSRAATTSGASGSRLPAPGNWAVFDRTWYGRVLVERIEGFCSVKADGSGPTARSTSSSASSPTTARASSSSSSMSAPRSRSGG